MCSKAELSPKAIERIIYSVFTLDFLLSIHFFVFKKICWRLLFFFCLFFWNTDDIWCIAQTAMGALKYLNIYLNIGVVCNVHAHMFDSEMGGKTLITVKYHIISCVSCFTLFFIKVCSPVERWTVIHKCLFLENILEAFYELHILLKRWWPTDEQPGYWQPKEKFAQSEMTSAISFGCRYIICLHILVTQEGFGVVTTKRQVCWI